MTALIRGGVFRKDLSDLIRLAGYLGAGLVLAVLGHGLLTRWNTGSWPAADATLVAFLLTLFAFTLIFGVLAATQILTMEREAGTEGLLRRLPLSRGRLIGEKLGAGAVALLVVWAFGMAALHAADGFAIEPRATPFSIGTAPLNLTITLLGGYAATALVTVRVHQGAVALMLGLGIVLIGWYVAIVLGPGLLAPAAEPGTVGAWLALCLVVFAGPAVALRGARRLPRLAMLDGPLRILVWKSLGNVLPATAVGLGVAAVALLAVADASPATATAADRLLAASVVTALVMSMTAIGIAAFDAPEHDGALGPLHQHPVPRWHAFLAAFVASLPALGLMSATAAIVLARVMPAGMILVIPGCALAWLCGAAARTAFRSNSGAMVIALVVYTISLGAIHAWLSPADGASLTSHQGSNPLGNLFTAALIPLSTITAGVLAIALHATLARSRINADLRNRARIYALAHLAVAGVTVAACSVWRSTAGV